MKTIIIIDRFKNKVGKSKIYEHLRLFFYREEFLQWYKKYVNNELSPLDGNFKERWQFILDFEKDYDHLKCRQ